MRTKQAFLTVCIHGGRSVLFGLVLAMIGGCVTASGLDLIGRGLGDSTLRNPAVAVPDFGIGIGLVALVVYRLVRNSTGRLCTAHCTFILVGFGAGVLGFFLLLLGFFLLVDGLMSSGPVFPGLVVAGFGLCLVGYTMAREVLGLYNDDRRLTADVFLINYVFFCFGLARSGRPLVDAGFVLTGFGMTLAVSGLGLVLVLVSLRVVRGVLRVVGLALTIRLCRSLYTGLHEPVCIQVTRVQRVALANGYRARIESPGGAGGWSHPSEARLISCAAFLLPADARDERLEEWLGELAGAPAGRSRLAFASSLFIGMPKLAIILRRPASRRARR